jgi:protein arginine kinase activator
MRQTDSFHRLKGVPVKCQSCSKTATVHLTDIINGQKRELHLCQDCAEKQQWLKQDQINLTGLLQSVIGQHIGQVTDELSRLTCPACGIKYMEFKAEGRLGCPLDYEVFHNALEPLLMRIHRSIRHIGKVPRHGVKNAAQQRELVQLRQQLRNAIEAEAYEEAARLRDLLRQKEAADEPG